MCESLYVVYIKISLFFSLSIKNTRHAISLLRVWVCKLLHITALTKCPKCHVCLSVTQFDLKMVSRKRTRMKQLQWEFFQKITTSGACCYRKIIKRCDVVRFWHANELRWPSWRWFFFWMNQQDWILFYQIHVVWLYVRVCQPPPHPHPPPPFVCVSAIRKVRGRHHFHHERIVRARSQRCPHCPCEYFCSSLRRAVMSLVLNILQKLRTRP